MKVEFAYGKKYLSLNIAGEQTIDAIEIAPTPAGMQNEELVANALQNPIGTKPINEIISSKAAKDAVIIVNDITRPTPNSLILPPLLREIENGGISADKISLIVATGIHRGHTHDDNLAVFGEDICRKYNIENHNCDGNLLSLGILSNGMDLVINRTVAEADLLVTTGVVSLHYFAGYSGGRKSILPGIAARQVIETNHKMMNDERAKLGNYKDNPVSHLMVEAARRVGVDFILNVVTDSNKKVTFCAAGDVYDAWLKAVEFCEMTNVVRIKDMADIVIASCGGYPKDINMYQAQKALDAAVLAVKPGGTIILLAECREGLGEETFQEWIESASCPQDIINRFHSQFELGGHKAFAICRILDRAEIMLKSELDPASVRNMYMTPFDDMDSALETALRKHGRNARILLMPDATKVAVKVTNK